MTTVPLALANWNGDIMPLADVRVSVLDRGFLFGDAIYEVVRVYHGRPFLFQEHLARLDRNLTKMQLRSNAERLGARALTTLEASGFQEAVIYLQVTRGCAPRTHHFPHPEVPVNELIWVQPYQDRYAEKRRVGGSVIVIEDLRWKRCDIKSVNLLANCFGAEEAHSAGCDEALLMQSDGTLLEGTHSSLFGVRQQAVLTAPLGNHLLPGITRQLLMRLAQQAGIPVEERLLRRADLSEIDELFLTGTTTEIMPVVRVDGQDIGAGRPGPITQRLQQAYRDVIAALA